MKKKSQNINYPAIFELTTDKIPYFILKNQLRDFWRSIYLKLRERKELIIFMEILRADRDVKIAHNGLLISYFFPSLNASLTCFVTWWWHILLTSMLTTVTCECHILSIKVKCFFYSMLLNFSIHWNVNNILVRKCAWQKTFKKYGKNVLMSKK